MRWALLALLGAVAYGLWVWLRSRRAREVARKEHLAQLQKLCEEDIALLGEDLRRLDAEAVPLDDEARSYYQSARKSHLAAQRMIAWLSDADEVGAVTEALANGGHAVACARARMERRPPPRQRVPCLFNPQHGPSVFEVPYTAAGHGTYKVPACADDVARVRANEAPEIRQVEVHGRPVSYFEVGDAFAPYVEGYFGDTPAARRLFTSRTSWSGEPQAGQPMDPQGMRTEWWPS